MTSPEETEKIQALLKQIGERARQEAWDAGVPTCRMKDGDIVWDYPDGKTYGHIPLLMCDDRALYRIYSRNLSFGVFSKASRGFVGIREKFGDLYLFTEFHWDTGPPFGTVHPKEKLEMLPEEMSLLESLGTVGEKSRRPMEFSQDWRYKDTSESCNEAQGWNDKDGAVGEESGRPLIAGENKGWYYLDTKQPKTEEEWAVGVPNDALFKWLEEKGEQYRSNE